jgi:hypothetical protein
MKIIAGDQYLEGEVLEGMGNLSYSPKFGQSAKV